MTLQQIYDLAIQMGIKADPRGEAGIKKYLAKAKKEFDDLPEKKKKYFDKEELHSPYADSRILYGDPKTQIKRVLAGIDSDATEILLADRLSQKGQKIDAVIGHHPIGISLYALSEVMDLQIDTYEQVGVPASVAYALMHERIGEINRRIHPHNTTQTVDTARLLDMPLVNLHTMWDNMGDNFLKNHIKAKTFETVGEVMDSLMEIPEFDEAAKRKNPPIIVSGSEKAKAGRIAIFFTGGTNPSKEVYMEMAKAGISTLIDMHIPEEALTEVKKLHMNVINAGHMAGDSIGANLFLDQLEKNGIEVVAGSGLIRVKRSSH